MFEVRRNKLGLPFIDVFGNNSTGEYIPVQKKVIVGTGSVTTKMFGVAGGGVGLTKTAVNIPWKPVIAVGAAGAGLFAGYSLFGKKGTDQTQAQSQQQQPIQITKTISPVTTITTTITNANTYQIQEGSPGAYQAFEKKDSVSSSPGVGVSPSWAISPSQSASQGAEQGQAQGTDLMLVAAIAAVGLVAYGYVSKPKTGKRK